MAHPLETKIDAVRRQVRWRGLLYGICWVATVLLAAVVVAGGLDYFLRVEYRPARLLLTVGVLLATGWGVYRFLLPHLMSSVSDVAVAQRIQQRFPALKDKLASAVEFLKQSEDDVLAGSPALRRAVVVDALADVDELEVGEVIDRKPARRALMATIGIALVGTVVVLLDTVGSQIAVARLINPLGNNAWPKVNRLAFIDPPNRLASGALFEVELRDENDKLPDEVWIDFRFEEDSGPRVVTEAMQFVDGIMVASRDNVRRPFSYRARGGDHQSMPWYELEVVESPRVESLSITLQPPEYSGWPTTTTSGRIVGLVGTRVEFVASVSKQIRRASLVTDSGLRLPAKVHADGLGFSLGQDGADTLRIEQSDNYRFELVDTEEITGGAEDKWQIRAIADEPPTVAIEKPPAEIHVAAEATVPVRVLAKDRLAVRDISLKYIRSDASDTGEQTIELYSGPERVEPINESQLAELADGDRRIAEHAWALGPLGLAAGSQITFHAAARDYQPAEGKSPSQRIFVITKRELEERLARRQASILGELARAVRAQKDARARTGELEIQLDQVGRLSPDDLNQLQGLELAQRDIRRTLTADNDGVLPQIAALLDDVRNNKLDSPDMVRQLNGLSQLIKQLDREDLAEIESDLTAAQKNAQADARAAGDTQDKSSPDKADDQKADPGSKGEPPKEGAERDQDKPSARSREAQQSLTSAGQHQDHVVAALEQTLGDLQRWDNYRRFARQLAALDDAQGKVRQQTEKLRGQTLGRDLKDLSPQQRADLSKLAAKQQELARNFDKLLEGMDKTSKNLSESDPLAAESIADASHFARQKGVGNQMRTAGQNVERNQVEQAAGRQKGVGQDLQEMLDILSNRREQELARLVKKLREAEAELQQLREKQAGLRKKLKEAAKNPNEEQRRRELQRLAKQQRQLQEDIQRLARRLKRLQAERAGSKLAEAAGRMGQSGQAGESGDAGTAGQRAEQAEKDLEEAQQRLAQARRQAEADLAMEQLARLKDQLKAVADRQQAVLEQTERLEALRIEQGRLTRGQSISVTDLSRQQMGLHDETGQMAKKLTEAKIFELVLDRAATRMMRAGEKLGRLDTGDLTQAAEQQALAQLDLLIKALAEDKSQKGQGGGAGQGGGQSGGGGLRSIAELKLLKLTQQDLNLRTEENRQGIEQRVAEGRDVTELLEERTSLADEQGKLADITFDLVEAAKVAPEDDPDSLPDIRELDEDSDAASTDEDTLEQTPDNDAAEERP